MSKKLLAPQSLNLHHHVNPHRHCQCPDPQVYDYILLAVIMAAFLPIRRPPSSRLLSLGALPLSPHYTGRQFQEATKYGRQLQGPSVEQAPRVDVARFYGELQD